MMGRGMEASWQVLCLPRSLCFDMWPLAKAFYNFCLTSAVTARTS